VSFSKHRSLQGHYTKSHSVAETVGNVISKRWQKCQ